MELISLQQHILAAWLIWGNVAFCLVISSEQEVIEDISRTNFSRIDREQIEQLSSVYGQYLASREASSEETQVHCFNYTRKSDCPNTCDTTQLCDSNGETHCNTCFFHAHRCKYYKRKLTLMPIEKCNPQLTRGGGSFHCGHQYCTEEFKPVCGSDGFFYSNECFFKVAQCFNPYLERANNCPWFPGGGENGGGGGGGSGKPSEDGTTGTGGQIQPPAGHRGPIIHCTYCNVYFRRRALRHKRRRSLFKK